MHVAEPPAPKVPGAHDLHLVVGSFSNPQPQTHAATDVEPTAMVEKGESHCVQIEPVATSE